jgi:hypothetical protein
MHARVPSRRPLQIPTNGLRRFDKNPPRSGHTALLKLPVHVIRRAFATRATPGTAAAFTLADLFRAFVPLALY